MPHSRAVTKTSAVAIIAMALPALFVVAAQRPSRVLGALALMLALLAPDIADAQSKVTPSEPRAGSSRSDKNQPRTPEPAPDEESSGPQVGTSTQNTLRESMSGPEMIRLMEELGVITNLTEDDFGDPYIEAEFAQMQFFVISFDCTQDRVRQCGSFMFRVAYATDGVNADIMNEWNVAQRWTRAYMDEEFDPVLEMDVPLYGGLPETAMAERLRLWLESLEGFNDYLGL